MNQGICYGAFYKKHCCVNKLSINEMSNIYLINSLSVVIEKGCGYQFLIHLNEYSTLVDLTLTS